MRIRQPPAVIITGRIVLIAPLNGTSTHSPFVEVINEYDDDDKPTPDDEIYAVVDMHGSTTSYWDNFAQAADVLLSNTGWNAQVTPRFEEE